MKYLSSFSLYFFILMLSSCSDSTYDDIQISEDSNSDLITYQDVKPIIDNNCLNCHSNPPINNAPMSLTTYNEVKNAVLEGDLIGRISRNDGANGLMPRGGPRLSQDLIDTIVQWEQNALLEN